MHDVHRRGAVQIGAANPPSPPVVAQEAEAAYLVALEEAYQNALEESDREEGTLAWPRGGAPALGGGGLCPPSTTTVTACLHLCCPSTSPRSP